MIQTRYITVDEYNSFWNTNLAEDLGGDVEAVSFIYRVEIRLESYIASNFNRNVRFEFAHMTDFQKEQYKNALLYQVQYIHRNSDLDTDSGTDIERGVIVDNAYLEKISICRASKDFLISCGIWNRNLSSRGKYGRFTSL